MKKPLKIKGTIVRDANGSIAKFNSCSRIAIFNGRIFVSGEGGEPMEIKNGTLIPLKYLDYQSKE